MENPEVKAEGLTAESLPRSVVITGASSGIGRASALLIAREGFQVLAGVRREADARKLVEEGGSSQISPVMTTSNSIRGWQRLG